MAYRGDDLDLRTPQSPGPQVQEWPSSQDVHLNGPRGRVGQGRHGAIWVDDIVLDCCNHAFDVALAHRASEVRLEHLIYALTRIDGAQQILEGRGIRTAPLRVEAANVIATEIPVGTANGKARPRRSEALEEVLRLSAQQSYRRQAPVSVDDLLVIMLDSGLELGAVQRLRAVFHREVIPVAAELPRERIRPYYAEAPAPRSPTSELASLQSAQQSYMQTSRIDLLEQSIRTLTEELANERKVFSGVLQDLQRDIMAQREEQARFGGIGVDKYQGVFGDRLQGLEQALASSRAFAASDVSLLSDKLVGIERQFAAEIALTRQAIADLATRPLPLPDLSPLTHRLDVIEEAVLSRELADKIAALEGQLAAERAKAEQVNAAFQGALQSIGGLVERQPVEVANLLGNPIAERFNGLSGTIEQNRAAAADADANLQQRLVDLGTLLQGHVSRSEAAEQATVQEFTALHDTIAKLATSLNQEFTDLHDQIAKLNTNQHTLAAAIEAQSQEAARAFAAVAQRIDGLEKAQAKPVAMIEQLSTTTHTIHRLMVEKYFRRNRFWYWLFGTDDWLSASWPSQMARIAEELDVLKRP